MIKTLLVVLAVLVLAPLSHGHGFVGTPKFYCEIPGPEWLVHDYGALPGPTDGSFTVGCPIRPLTDGHDEYALLGAWLLVESGTGIPPANPSEGAGTLYCFGEEGHHANYPTVTVTDVAFNQIQPFTIAADTIDLTGTGEGCGDFFDDVSATCFFSPCTPLFPHGLDGAYHVYVDAGGSAGHVETN